MPALTISDAVVFRRSELLRGLSDGELETVLKSGAMTVVRKRDFLIRQGERATTQYLLLSGRLRVTQLAPDGQEVLLRFLGAGDTVGGVAALGDLLYTGSALAILPSRALAWKSAAFGALLDDCPRLARNTMHLMAGRIQELQARCGELATERVDRRVAHALLRAAGPALGGSGGPGGGVGVLRLSRRDLAEMTGTTLFTVSRILSRWARARIIDTGRQRVSIRDRARLAAIADDLSL